MHLLSVITGPNVLGVLFMQNASDMLPPAQLAEDVTDLQDVLGNLAYLARVLISPTPITPFIYASIK